MHSSLVANHCVRASAMFELNREFATSEGGTNKANFNSILQEHATIVELNTFGINNLYSHNHETSTALARKLF